MLTRANQRDRRSRQDTELRMRSCLPVACCIVLLACEDAPAPEPAPEAVPSAVVESFDAFIEDRREAFLAELAPLDCQESADPPRVRVSNYPAHGYWGSMFTEIECPYYLSGDIMMVPVFIGTRFYLRAGGAEWRLLTEDGYPYSGPGMSDERRPLPLPLVLAILQAYGPGTDYLPALLGRGQ
jgi:hypothetical protein